MDTRLIILAATFALVVVSILLLIVALMRSRKADMLADEPMPIPGNWPMLASAPDETQAQTLDGSPFDVPQSGMAAVLSQPLRTGTWRPNSPEPESATASPSGDYWDSLIDESDLLLKSPGVQKEPIPVPIPAPGIVPTPNPVPEPVAPFEPQPEPEPEPEPEREAEPESEPTPELVPLLQPSLPVSNQSDFDATETLVVQSPQLTDDAARDWLEDLVAELEADIPVAPRVELPAVSTPAPVVAALTSIPALVPAPVVVPVPEPVPAIVNEPTSTPEAEIAEIMASFSAVPSAEPRPMASVPSTPIPPAVDHRPSAAVPPRVPQDRPAVVAHAPASAPATNEPQASVRSTAPALTPPVHELVAPVEMWFGDARVGVKPGSKTYDRFQRIAKVLFDDLARAKPPS
ncbi:MAG: hypothetical protein Q8K89_05615 [Actinomycetota bacterium]|nr:hypothetical protein [Actinomycetota bacterium]